LTFSDLAAQVQFYIVLIDIRPSSQPEQARNASARFRPRLGENSKLEISSGKLAFIYWILSSEWEFNIQSSSKPVILLGAIPDSLTAK